MQLRKIIAGMALVFCASKVTAQIDAVNEKQPQQLTLTGRVVSVYTSDTSPKQSPPTSLTAVEVSVESIAGSARTDVEVGQRVFIKIARLIRSPDGFDLLPTPGDISEFQVTGRSGVFDVSPAGYRVVLPGRYQSESIGLRMSLIPTGIFQMGSPPSEENRRPDELQHRVAITKPFYIGIYEVTQFEYHQVMNSKPSAFAPGGSDREKVPMMVTDQFPVENVSWFDAIRFCNRLSEKDGLAPYYAIESTTDAADATRSPIVKIAGGKGFRLPSEAEWEYACRANTETPFHFGTETTIKSGNIKAPIVAAGYGVAPKWRDLGRSAKVGSYSPNDWGLFDMHGNVAEWCEDWYDKDYYVKFATDPTGPDHGIHRVLRGGSGMVSDAHSRSAARSFHVPQEAKYFSGFRVARNP